MGRERLIILKVACLSVGPDRPIRNRALIVVQSQTVPIPSPIFVVVVSSYSRAMCGISFGEQSGSAAGSKVRRQPNLSYRRLPCPFFEYICRSKQGLALFVVRYQAGKRPQFPGPRNKSPECFRLKSAWHRQLRQKSNTSLRPSSASPTAAAPIIVFRTNTSGVMPSILSFVTPPNA